MFFPRSIFASKLDGTISEENKPNHDEYILSINQRSDDFIDIDYVREDGLCFDDNRLSEFIFTLAQNTPV